MGNKESTQKEIKQNYDGNISAVKDGRRALEPKGQGINTFQQPDFDNNFAESRLLGIIERESDPIMSFLPRELIMIIFEYSSIETIFRALQYINIDFHNFLFDENFCQRFFQRKFSNPLENEKTYVEALFFQYLQEKVPIHLDFHSKFESSPQSYTSPSFKDTRVIRFRVDRNKIKFFLHINSNDSWRSYHGQGQGVSNVIRTDSNYFFEGEVSKIDTSKEERKKRITVDLSSYQCYKKIDTEKHPYAKEHEIIRKTTQSLLEGLIHTDMKQFQVTWENYNNEEEMSLRIIFDSFERPFQYFWYHDESYISELFFSPYETDLDFFKNIWNFYHPETNQKSISEKPEYVKKSPVKQTKL